MISLGAVSLPDDMLWIDEYGWSAVRQSREVFLSGVLVVEEAAQLAGRPVTLQGGWVSRTTVQQLDVLLQTAGASHTLDLNGTLFTVMFRHSEGGMTVTPIQPVSDPSPDDLYELTLRLMVV